MVVFGIQWRYQQQPAQSPNATVADSQCRPGSLRGRAAITGIPTRPRLIYFVIASPFKMAPSHQRIPP